MIDKQNFVLETQEKIKSFDEMSDVDFMSMTIFGESRGGSDLLKENIGVCVLTRRLIGGWYGNSIKEVVTKQYQFSCFNIHDINYDKIQHPLKYEKIEIWLKCYSIAEYCLEKYYNFTDLIKIGATHYESINNPLNRPNWTKEYKLVNIIENTRFYKVEII